MREYNRKPIGISCPVRNVLVSMTAVGLAVTSHLDTSACALSLEK